MMVMVNIVLKIVFPLIPLLQKRSDCTTAMQYAFAELFPLIPLLQKRSDCQVVKALLYKVFKTGFREPRSKVPFQRSPCQIQPLSDRLKSNQSKSYSVCANLAKRYIASNQRRPLHWNNPYPGLRGSYWELEGKQLAYNLTVWQSFLQEVKDAFIAVQPLNGNPAPCSPGNPGKRCQDVLNHQSQIYLIPCPDLLHPEEVDNWRTQGTTPEVRGDALDLLYENRFKGVNQQGIGNANVGGRISETGSTPSYVAIKSNFPSQAPAYQAVTIFGANQRDRSDFAKKLCSLTHLHIM